LNKLYCVWRNLSHFNHVILVLKKRVKYLYPQLHFTLYFFHICTSFGEIIGHFQVCSWLTDQSKSVQMPAISPVDTFIQRFSVKRRSMHIQFYDKLVPCKWLWQCADRWQSKLHSHRWGLSNCLRLPNIIAIYGIEFITLHCISPYLEVWFISYCKIFYFTYWFTVYLVTLPNFRATKYSVINLLKLLVTWFTNKLTFNNCTLCPHCICVLHLSENKQWHVPLTA
jgi:hypothetical protein